jgi:hypothetical protein
MPDKIFNNSEIFTSENDFIMGGINVNASKIEWGVMKGMMEHRVYVALDNWIKGEMAAPSINDNITEKVKFENAITNLAEKIEAMLGIKVQSLDIDSIAEEIINSQHYNCWQQKVSIRYHQFLSDHKELGVSVPVVYDGDGVSSDIAKEETEEVSLDKILEILSGIFN